jgi:hypothetical protein
VLRRDWMVTAVVVVTIIEIVSLTVGGLLWMP